MATKKHLSLIYELENIFNSYLGKVTKFQVVGLFRFGVLSNLLAWRWKTPPLLVLIGLNNYFDGFTSFFIVGQSFYSEILFVAVGSSLVHTSMKRFFRFEQHLSPKIRHRGWQPTPIGNGNSILSQ